MTKDEPLSRESFTRYLYGQMSEPEREGIERALADAGSTAFEDFITFEDQMIDDYVRGQMQPAERQAFEKHYVNFSRRRRERVELASSLIAHGDELQALAAGPVGTVKAAPVAPATPPGDPRPDFRKLALAYSLAALTLIASIVAVVLHSSSPSGPPQDIRQTPRRTGEAEPSASTDARVATPSPEESAHQARGHEPPNKKNVPSNRISPNKDSAQPHDNPDSTRERSAPAPSDEGDAGYAAVIPPSSGERNGEPGMPTVINIVQSKASLDLTLPLRQGHVFKIYRALIVTRGGNRVGPARGVEAAPDASNRFVKLKLRAELLQPGDYSIKLYGIDPEIDPGEIPVDDYPFSLRTGKTPAN
jgi:hypothetical protein